jgi:two-component system, OmpR family, phosphate regulon sensor histidine kinase PhoR
MQEQAERMSRLVSDLLSLSRIELDEHRAPQGRADMTEIARVVADALTVKARARNMIIEISAPDGLPQAIGDERELEQVLQNLIDNAIKYGRDGSCVRVSARRVGADRPAAVAAEEVIAVAVIDEGEGIAPDHLPRLTERFYRVDTARSRELGGTGLGLAIVKHIVSHHRGHLTIESKQGKGSTFTVFLPAVPAGANGVVNP